MAHDQLPTSINGYDVNVYILTEGIIDLHAYPLQIVFDPITNQPYFEGDYREKVQQTFPLYADNPAHKEAIDFLIPNPDDRYEEYDEWTSNHELLDSNCPEPLYSWLKSLPEYEVKIA